MAAENWSFTPPLDSHITTAETTDGKLQITVPSGVFTTDTQYTVKYDDKNGCTASTIFYIKKDCSGGGGGDTGKINVRIVNESGVDTLCFATHSGGNIKVYTTSNPSESYFITIPEGTYIIQRGLPEIFNDCPWQPNGNVQPLPLSSEAKIYAPDQTGGANSGVITIVNETTGSKMSDLREITLKVTSVQEDSGGNYMKCSNTCTIANKTIAADVTGSVEIASLPSLGTWSFNPDSTSWLGAIQQYGTSNRVIATSAQQIPNDMSITITATCTSDECGDCKNNPITFTVTKKGTSSPVGDKVRATIKVINNTTKAQNWIMEYFRFYIQCSYGHCCIHSYTDKALSNVSGRDVYTSNTLIEPGNTYTYDVMLSKDPPYEAYNSVDDWLGSTIFTAALDPSTKSDSSIMAYGVKLDNDGGQWTGHYSAFSYNNRPIYIKREDGESTLQGNVTYVVEINTNNNITYRRDDGTTYTDDNTRCYYKGQPCT